MRFGGASVTYLTRSGKSFWNKGLRSRVRPAMNVGKPTAVQILVAWRETKWLVLRNTEEVGAYAYRGHAMDMARTLAAEAAAQGLDCYMLARERDGTWAEHPCPKPARCG